MAQVVKLKRTAVQGKVPSTSNVELGELAINTYDGRIFFEKSSSAESIQEILTTNAGRPITGSINLNGAITASYFKGDGSALTNVTANISEQATVTSSFDSESTIDVAHNFSSKNVIVSVYDSSDGLIIPQSVTLTSVDNVRVVLSQATSGFVVVAKGGHVLSGSADNANQLNGQTAAYYLNYNNFTNVPSGLVSGSSQIDAQSATNPAAIYDNSGTPTLRSGITAMEVRTLIGLDDTDQIQFSDLTIGDSITLSSSTGNTLAVESETDSTSTSTGAITTLGGVGIAKNLNVGGTLSAPSASFEKAFIGTGSNNVEINYNGNNGTDIIAKYALNNSQSHTITLNAPSINIGYDSVTNDYADNIRLYGLQAVTETNALVISDGQVVGTRELGSNAFNSTTYLENLNGTGVISGSAQVVSSLLNQNVNLGSGKLTSTDIEFSGDISGSSTSTGSFGRVEVNANTLQIGNQEINQTLLSNVKNVFSSTTSQDGSVSLADSLPSGVISGSSFSSPSQGTVRATINGTNTDVDTGLQTGDSPQFTNLTLTGNLTVQGTTTTIDSTTVNIGDNILELNYGGSATTSGILTKDATGGSTTSGSLLWDATNDYWKVGKLGSESEVITTSNIVTNLPTGTISGSSQTVAHLVNKDVNFGTGDITASVIATSTIHPNVGDDTISFKTGTYLDGILEVEASRLKGQILATNGVISGSSQITDLTTHKETVSGASSYAVTHNLNEQYPIVQCWDTSTSQQVQASDVTSNSANQVTVSFATNFAGVIIVKK